MCELAPQVSQVIRLRQSENSDKFRDYGFVHFTERASALKAVEETQAGKVLELGGKNITVSMARPQVGWARAC